MPLPGNPRPPEGNESLPGGRSASFSFPSRCRVTAALLTVGDELLIGQVVNTNAAWLGAELTAHGLTVARVLALGDEPAAITEAVRGMLRTADVLILTGGLGPTHDDLTKRAVAEALGRRLAFHPELLAEVEAWFAARGRRMPAANRLLAEVPEGFEPLPNPVGTAPGLWYAGPVPGLEGERVVVLLPGVPYEMQTIAREAVLPRLMARQGESALAQKTWLTVGKGESDLAEQLGDLSGWLSDRLRLAYLPSYGIVRLRATAFGDTAAEARMRLGAFEAFVRERLGDLIFGEGEDTLEAAVGRLLAARGLTLATAESCTGGRVADALTNVPGSSTYFVGGAVVYANEAKVHVLGVDEGVLRTHGAVSEPVALQLAEGARRRFGADVAVATTGVAGPGGGTAEKPVGTVWLGYADALGRRAVRLQLTPDRHLNKHLATTFALDLVRRQLLRRERAPAGTAAASNTSPAR